MTSHWASGEYKAKQNRYRELAIFCKVSGERIQNVADSHAGFTGYCVDGSRTYPEKQLQQALFAGPLAK